MLRPNTQKTPPARMALFAVALLAAVVLGTLIDPGRSSYKAVPAPQPSDPAPDRSREGAVATVAAWLDALDTRQELLDSEGLRASIERLVVSGARADLTAKLARVASDLRAEGVVPPPTVRSAPVGYRVLAFTDDEATVATWEVVTRASAEIAPSVLWAQTRLTVVWENGWRIQDSTAEYRAPTELDAQELATLDLQHRSFSHAP